MGLELADRLFPGHVRYEAKVELGLRAAGKNRLAARSRIAAD